MKINFKMYRKLLIIVFSFVSLTSCKNYSNIENTSEVVTIDTSHLIDSIKNVNYINLIKKENIDTTLDRGLLLYSIDGEKLLHKNTIFEHDFFFKDIYKLKNETHITFIQSVNYIDLVCTTEQADSIRYITDKESTSKLFPHKTTYIIYEPFYIKKINFEYVLNQNDDDDPTTQEDATLELNSSNVFFKIKGKLKYIKVLTINNLE